MDIHKNARLTLIVEKNWPNKFVSGVTLNSAAAEFKVSPKTAAKWVRRYQQHGASPSAAIALRVRSTRRRRTPPNLSAKSNDYAASAGPACRIAQHHRSEPRHRQPHPAPPPAQPPARSGTRLLPSRYEHPAPGDLLHLDIKKLGRFGAVAIRITGNRQRHVQGVGWEYVHVAIDDHSRIAFSHILPESESSLRRRFPPCRRGLLRPPGHHHPPRAHRQRTLLPLALLPPPARQLAIASASPAPTPRAPTAKPNASSKPPCANGPMPALTTTPRARRSNCPLGSTSTTGIAPC